MEVSGPASEAGVQGQLQLGKVKGRRLFRKIRRGRFLFVLLRLFFNLWRRRRRLHHRAHLPYDVVLLRRLGDSLKVRKHEEDRKGQDDGKRQGRRHSETSKQSLQ